MKVLVTGGAGYIGTHLVDALRQAGDAVCVLDISPISDEHLIDTGCDFLQGSVADRSLVAQAMRDVEVVCHLAWGFYPGDERREVQENFSGTLNPLEAALAAGVRHFLFASTAVVYGPTGPIRVDEDHPCHPERSTIGGPVYGITKLACEKLCLVYQWRGLPVTIFRMHGVFSQGRLGQFGQMIEQTLAGEPVKAIHKAGGEYAHLEDVVQAFLLAIDNPKAHGKVFNLAGSHIYRDPELARYIVEATDSESQVELIEDPTQAMISVSVDKLRGVLGYEAGSREFLTRLIGRALDERKAEEYETDGAEHHPDLRVQNEFDNEQMFWYNVGVEHSFYTSSCTGGMKKMTTQTPVLMGNRKSTLKADPTEWLLEPENPSVRYWTLAKLLDRTEGDEEVIETRRAIMERGPAAEILSHYASDGRWEGERGYYTYKYTSTHWQLLLLAELAADGQDERIAAACQRMIDEVYGDDRSTVLPCFHGNLIGYLHALGHGHDERVEEFEAELARAGTAGEWRCGINGDLPCAWGVARALWGFGHIPGGERSGAVQEAIESGVRFLGRFELCEGNYPGSGRRHKLWDRLNFPLFYQADVLFVLRTLTDVGCVNEKPAFRRALEWLEARRRDDGRWNGVSPYGSHMWTQLEPRRRPSKWITWQALYAIKAADA